MHRRLSWLDALSIVGFAAALYVVYRLLRRASWPTVLLTDVPALLVGVCAGAAALLLAGVCLATIALATGRVQGSLVASSIVAANRTVLTKYLPGKIWYVIGISETLVDVGLSRSRAWAVVLLYQAVLIVTALVLGLIAGGEFEIARRLAETFPGSGLWLHTTFVIIVAMLLAVGVGWLARQNRMAALRRVNPRWLLVGVCVALVYWILQGLSVWMILSAVHGTWLALGTVLVVPAVYAIGFLVLIAPGGMGVRELLFVQYFVHLGMSADTAAALAIVARIASLLTELVVWLALHIGVFRRPGTGTMNR